MSEQKASMGRIVIYNHPNKIEDGEHNVIKSPAIIMQALQSTEEQKERQEVNLFVISNAIRNPLLFPENVEYGEGPNQWNWPLRI